MAQRAHDAADSIGNLVELTELRLDGNRLTALPAGFHKLRELRRLQLRDDPFATPPTGVPRRCKVDRYA